MRRRVQRFCLVALLTLIAPIGISAADDGLKVFPPIDDSQPDAPPTDNGGDGGIAGGPCSYIYDDGAAEVSVGGLPIDFAWMSRFDVDGDCAFIRNISVCWGTPAGASAPPNGTPARIYVWDDPNDDGNPIDAVLLAEVNVTIQNRDTNILNVHALPTPAIVSGVFFIGASVHITALQYVAPLDTTTSYVSGRSWWVWDNTTFVASNLAGNDQPPMEAPQHRHLRLQCDAQTIKPVTYQGRLTQSGTPVTGTADLRFTVFDSASGGTQIGDQLTISDASITDGLFTVQLPIAPDIFDGQPRWLRIEAAYPAGGPFALLLPRQPITAAPEAIFAHTAASISGDVPWSNLSGIPAGFADGVDNGGDGHSLDAADGSPTNVVYVDNGGNVGVGTVAPAEKLHVIGDQRISSNSVVNTTVGSGALAILNTGATAGLHMDSTAIQTLGPGNDLQINADNTNPTHINGALHVLTDGSVGIGAATPEGPLHVHESSAGAITANGSSTAVFERGGTNYLSLLAPDASERGILFGDSVKGSGAAGLTYDHSSAPNSLQLVTSVRAVTVMEAGNVGVGTTAPESPLHVLKGSAGSITANANAPLVVENSANCYVNVLTPTGGEAGVLFGAPIAGNSSAGVVFNDVNFSLNLRTSGTNRMEIAFNGNIGVGRTATTNKLEVEGAASKTAAGSWLANSDARIKRDVQTITDPLATLDKIRLVEFRYTDEYRAAHPSIEDRLYLNVIAQEFAEVFPDSVKSSGEKLPGCGPEDSDREILQVDTYPLTIYSAAAVQELHRIVTRQAGQIDGLRTENEMLRTRLERIEALLTQSAVEAPSAVETSHDRTGAR